MNPLLWIFQFGFRCHHGQLSRVFTINQRTYQVCFECGQEVEYSWERMRSMRPKAADDTQVSLHAARRAEVSAM